jgi:hypothetical protein
MIDKVFSINGTKVSALIADDEGLKFSSATAASVDDFRASYDKQLSLANKFQIKYGSIKSVKKEDNDKDILIKYKSLLGVPSEFEFSFNDDADNELFFTFLEKERYFTKIHETLTPFRAALNYIIGLLAVSGATVFCYYQAIKIASGTATSGSGAKGRLFNYVIGFLGEKGVLAVGIAIALYLVYKIRARYSNPPNQLRLLPPNA